MGLGSSQYVSGTKQTSAVASTSELLTYSYATSIRRAIAEDGGHWFALYLLFGRDGPSVCNLVCRRRLL
jgi:hypothetical protein